MALVVVRRFMNPDEAQMAKATLDGADIESSIRGDEASRTIPGVALAQGILLEVDEANLERARGLLDTGAEIDEAERAAHPELQEGPASVVVPKARLDATQNISRAFRASIIGLFVCPGILHLYSLWLLRGAFSEWTHLTPKERTTTLITLAIVAVAFTLPLVFVIVNR